MSRYSALNEKQLIQKIAAGDEVSFTVLFEQYYKKLTDFIVKYIKSPVLAEDIAQDVFIKIWDNKEKLREIELFSSYLFTMTRNYTFNVLKSAGRNETLKFKIAENYTAVTAGTDDKLLTGEYHFFLNKKLQEMPDRSRHVFSLCKLEGRSYDEVAAALGISRNAVKNHVVFSNKFMKDAVKKEYGISLSLFLLVITGMR